MSEGWEQRENSQRMTRGEDRIGKLEADLVAAYGRVAMIEGTLGRIESDLYNHGKDGMKTVLTSLVAKMDEREAARKRYEEERKRGDAWFRFGLAIVLSIILSLLGIVAKRVLAEDFGFSSLHQRTGADYSVRGDQ